MSDGLKKRQKAAVGAFAHREELGFRAVALRNRKLALWAGGLMGLDGAAMDKYIDQLLLVSVRESESDAVFKKLLDDFDIYHVDVTERTLHRKIDELLAEALAELGEATPR